MDRKLLGALVAGAILLGILAAVVVLQGSAAEACPAGSARAPEGECQADAEACYTYLDGAASTTVRCTAESRDGNGYVHWRLGGSGDVTVRVRDASGNTIYERSETLSGQLDDLDPIRGAAGAWTLETTFRGASGGGDIILWG